MAVRIRISQQNRPPASPSALKSIYCSFIAIEEEKAKGKISIV